MRKEGVVSRAGTFVKRLLCNPIPIFLIFIGLGLIIFSTQVHAMNAASSQLSTDSIAVQPGTSVPVKLVANFTSNNPATISFQVNAPNGITVDGPLHSISTVFPINRQVNVGASSSTLPGDYLVTFTVHTILDNQLFVQQHSLWVHVGAKSLVSYFTSPNTTLAPQITNISISPQVINLKRGETGHFSVSFINRNSATDYVVRLVEQVNLISVHLTNATPHFVEPNEQVVVGGEIVTTSKTPFGFTPIYLEAYDVLSGQKTFLGVVSVNVVETTNIEASLPFLQYVISPNRSQATFITLTNTEFNDTDVTLESSSSLVQIESHIVHVPAKTSVSVPVLIHADSVQGLRNEVIFVQNAQFSTSVSFSVRTTPVAVDPVALESREEEIIVTNTSPFAWTDVTFIAANVPSDWVVSFESNHIAIPAQKSVTVPVHVDAVKGEEDSFVVHVYNHGQLVDSYVVQSTPAPNVVSGVTGLIVANVSSIIGLIVIIFALLVVFSKSFRESVQSRLPKPKHPVYNPLVRSEKKVEMVKREEPISKE